MAQRIEIVAVLIAAGDGENARADHRGMTVKDACRIAFVMQAGSERTGDIEPLFKRAQQEHAAVTRQRTAIEPGVDIQTIHR